MNRPEKRFRARLAALAAGGALLLGLFPLAGTALAVAPPAPSVPDLAVASDTGSSSTDNITKTLIGLVFTGTAEAGSTVKVLVGGTTQIGTAVAAGGAYSVTTTVAIPDNTAANLITATATNAAAEVSLPSGALTVTTDNTVPGVPSTPDLEPASDTGTSSTDNITSDTTPTFTGTSDANATVQLFAGLVSVGTAVASGTTWTITSAVVAPGVHLFTAIQTDAAGNGPSGASASLSVTIDTAVPAAPSTPDLAPASDTGASTTDNITSDTTPTFTGTAEAGSTVALFAGTTQVGTGTATAGSWTITSSALTAGTYSFTAKATNLAGTSLASPGLSVSVLTALGVTVNQATGQADPTATTPINFTVVFTSSVSNFATGDVTIGGTAGGSKTATVTGSGTTYSVAITGMTTTGTVVPTVAAAVATDLAGNSNTASTSDDNSVAWDTTGPTVTINQASAQTDPTATSPINFTVVFSASVTGFVGTDVTLTGTAGATTAVVTGGPSTYNVAVSGMTVSGTVTAAIAADRALSTDTTPHPNRASTSTDGTVSFRLAGKYLVTSSNYAPLPGSAVTITAQLADSANNAVPVSGTVVTWSKSGTGGSFSAATSTTNASGIATVTFTVGTTNGTVYTAIATSPGGITGTSSNITVTAPAAVMTLLRSTGMVTYGASARLSVQFSANGGSRAVFLEYTYAGIPWTTVASTTTNSTGFASATYKPARSGYYRIRFDGATDLSAAYSNVVLIGVRQTITLNPTHSGTMTIAKGRSITFRGALQPLRPDGAASRVTFRFYQKKSGTWVLKYERHVATDGSGVARTTFKFGVGGNWYVMCFADRTPVNAVSRYSQREYFFVQ